MTALGKRVLFSLIAGGIGALVIVGFLYREEIQREIAWRRLSARVLEFDTVEAFSTENRESSVPPDWWRDMASQGKAAIPLYRRLLLDDRPEIWGKMALLLNTNLVKMKVSLMTPIRSIDLLLKWSQLLLPDIVTLVCLELVRLS